jgi:hypothetical protein
MTFRSGIIIPSHDLATVVDAAGDGKLRTGDDECLEASIAEEV